MDVLGNDSELISNFTEAMHNKAIKDAVTLANELPISDSVSMLDIG